MTNAAHTRTQGPITLFVGNAKGGGLIRIEAAHDSPEAGEHIASLTRGRKREADAAMLVAGWNALEQAKPLLATFNEAAGSQRTHGPDINLIVLANYGALALDLLRAALKAAGVEQ